VDLRGDSKKSGLDNASNLTIKSTIALQNGKTIETQVTKTYPKLKSLHDHILDTFGSSNKDLEGKLQFPYVASGFSPPGNSLFMYAPALLLGTCAIIAGSEHSSGLLPLDRNPTMQIALGCACAIYICLLSLVSKLSKGMIGSELMDKDLMNNYLQRVLALSGSKTNAGLVAFLQPTLREDWPLSVGDIDLSIQDLPHESSQTEWWYFNSHIKTTAGKDFSLFCCFFATVKHIDDRSGKKTFAYALNWAISDVENETYVGDIFLDKDSPEMVLKSLENDSSGIEDRMLRKAMREVLLKGNVPLPDKMFTTKPRVSKSKLSLNFQGAQLSKNAKGHYILSAETEDGADGFCVTFTPQKKPVRHGAAGVVKGHNGDDMFYYCITRNRVSGSIRVGGENHVISSANSSGWYDHEFGGAPPAKGQKHMEYAWNWAAIQLSNGMDITAAVLIDPRDGSVMEKRALVVPRSGPVIHFEDDDLSFEARESKPETARPAEWTSMKTFRTYPTCYHLSIQSLDLDVDIVASFDDQEFITLIAKPAFWEGRVDVSGTLSGGSVSGLGYVERNGFDKMPKLNDFFKAVGKATRASACAMYPDNPTYEEARELIADEDMDHWMEGVPLDIFQKTVIAPVREIIDRGGKSWRSYGALACCDVVGGDSRKYAQWLAMPEFMHVGSLLVDDIQDQSELRRGGKCAHLLFGEALTINAGTAAYFMCERLLKAPDLTAEQLNKVYQLYFSALRAGHAGQGLDINGLDYMMDGVVESGSGDLLEERVLGIHRLKTAVPAGTLARMGALVGGGTHEQIEIVGRFFEGVGVAFQIMDDVLNLRGLYSTKADKAKKAQILKTLGEDIKDGKVTMPIAKAMTRLNKKERKALWTTVKSKPQDQKTVLQCIAKLEACGAIDACTAQADILVEDAWRELDKVCPDSFSKIMLRSFGSFVVERCR
jgi:geranylgeranyl pyrophosphate synthase/predicted secreted hydrolase